MPAVKLGAAESGGCSPEPMKGEAIFKIDFKCVSPREIFRADDANSAETADAPAEAFKRRERR
jgi:hypothetical protein